MVKEIEREGKEVREMSKMGNDGWCFFLLLLFLFLSFFSSSSSSPSPFSSSFCLSFLLQLTPPLSSIGPLELGRHGSEIKFIINFLHLIQTPQKKKRKKTHKKRTRRRKKFREKRKKNRRLEKNRKKRKMLTVAEDKKE
jgi:hypothetical protein